MLQQQILDYVRTRPWAPALCIALCLLLTSMALVVGVEHGKQLANAKLELEPLPDSIPAKWNRLYILKDTTREEPIYIGIMDMNKDRDYQPIFDALKAQPNCKLDWLERNTADEMYVQYLRAHAGYFDMRWETVFCVDPVTKDTFGLSLDWSEHVQHQSNQGDLEAFNRLLDVMEMLNYKTVDH